MSEKIQSRRPNPEKKHGNPCKKCQGTLKNKNGRCSGCHADNAMRYYQRRQNLIKNEKNPDTGELLPLPRTILHIKW
jgi:predicted ATP-dependent serine protease